ncbi:uncharacterized protein RJT20DRAFT_137080 [Scheffersomyces xylosifermentans]|uniref:uncharacterized protein n=1 Tax=Scheffersomyces xylosifermentans TaxID=1304137 RepID=UPI00315C86D4
MAWDNQYMDMINRKSFLLEQFKALPREVISRSFQHVRVTKLSALCHLPRCFLCQFARQARKEKGLMQIKIYQHHYFSRSQMKAIIRKCIENTYSQGAFISNTQFYKTKFPQYLPLELHIYDVDLLLFHVKIPKQLSKLKIVLYLTDYVTAVPNFKYNIQVIILCRSRNSQKYSDDFNHSIDEFINRIKWDIRFPERIPTLKDIIVFDSRDVGSFKYIFPNLVGLNCCEVPILLSSLRSLPPDLEVLEVRVKESLVCHSENIEEELQSRYLTLHLHHDVDHSETIDLSKLQSCRMILRYNSRQLRMVFPSNLNELVISRPSLGFHDRSDINEEWTSFSNFVNSLQDHSRLRKLTLRPGLHSIPSIDMSIHYNSQHIEYTNGKCKFLFGCNFIFPFNLVQLLIEANKTYKLETNIELPSKLEILVLARISLDKLEEIPFPRSLKILVLYDVNASLHGIRIPGPKSMFHGSSIRYLDRSFKDRCEIQHFFDEYFDCCRDPVYTVFMKDNYLGHLMSETANDDHQRLTKKISHRV